VSPDVSVGPEVSVRALPFWVRASEIVNPVRMAEPLLSTVMV
jgi:hypothetical protein